MYPLEKSGLVIYIYYSKYQDIYLSTPLKLIDTGNQQ